MDRMSSIVARRDKVASNLSKISLSKCIIIGLLLFFAPHSSPDEFLCYESANKTCIDASLVCNQIRDCPSGEDETSFCQPQICPSNTFRCNHGRCIDANAVCDNFNDCLNAEDEADSLCKSISCGGNSTANCNDGGGSALFCPPIVSERLHASCKYANRDVSCEKDIKPGTKARYTCSEFFEAQNWLHKYNHHAVCQANGQWSSEILKCEPKCGYISNTLPLIVNSHVIDPANVPWHATIFVRSDDEASFAFACGGTLISELVVLSAAHCFASVNEKSVKIAVGKRSSNFTISSSDDEPLAQLFDVEQIYRHPLYMDRLGNFGSDIALVELAQTVSLSDAIHPACIDWSWDDLTWHLANKSMGVVAGMGVTEDDVTSEMLRLTHVPVVDDEHCIRAQSEDFRKYIRFSTFCGGWANGTSVCNGDSGGGLLFQSKAGTSKWIVQGIVSLSPRRQSTFFCDPYKFTVFTKVALYVNWIRSILDEIHVAHEKMLRTRLLDEHDPIL